MAQKDAMEQAKEFLRLVIKYRFWISISVAALFALIAYFVGSGPVRAKAADETKKITAAESTVKQYASSAIPTAKYKPIVEEKTGILDKDVNAAWKTLFDRQAPLLTWPDTVQERFRTWGRKWPENTAPQKVELAIDDYIEAYPAYVAMVYKTFHPFDYETGEGIVVSQAQDDLLRPSVFSKEHLPDLGKVWAAQERLWIQHTLLEVVAQVNKNAKNWDSAIIRQIELLEVGNPSAQDQRSLAKSETLAEAEGIYAPGEHPTEAAPGTSDASMGSNIGMAMRAAGMGGRGMGGGPGVVGGSESVYYVKSGNENQYKILPVSMTVLIEQDHVQDFLIELENSPMSIQVMDFELKRPTAAITKPEKGEMAPGGMGGMMGRMMGGMMGRGMTAMGGMAGQMQQAMREQMMAQMRGNMGMGMMRGMGMMGMGGAGAAPERKGKDMRSVNRQKTREEQDKAVEKSKGVSYVDPYYNIVEVTFYGQARFFNPPPAGEPVPASPGDVAGAAAPGGSTPAAPAAATTAPSASPGAPGKTETAVKAPAAGQEEPDAAAKAPAAAAAKAKDADEGDDAPAASPDAAAPKTKNTDKSGAAAPKAASPADAKSDDDAADDEPPAKPSTPKSKAKNANPPS
jgi:hypothetical protein